MRPLGTSEDHTNSLVKFRLIFRLKYSFFSFRVGVHITHHILCFEEAAFGGGRLDLQCFGVSQKKLKCSIKVCQVDALGEKKKKTGLKYGL